jgi:hypothetical protein
MRVCQPAAPPITAAEVQPPAIVPQDVQLMRREAVLITRVEHHHFLRVQLDVGSTKKKAVRLPVRLVVKPLGTQSR